MISGCFCNPSSLLYFDCLSCATLPTATSCLSVFVIFFFLLLNPCCPDSESCKYRYQAGVDNLIPPKLLQTTQSGWQANFTTQQAQGRLLKACYLKQLHLETVL
ncbi:hypothetical protein AMECASPLE_038459 [Ameca splendens]|uniref:Uncharacterized protein n=1 Tax=Ameca splendens TaxID=208324 RepID=A0ABV0Y823_9TELE